MTITATTHYPHHPHFVSATPSHFGGIQYEFRAFTGDEPEPQGPTWTEDLPQDEARYAEYRERRDEIEAAHRLWELARYRRQLEPMLRKAAAAWPAVAEAKQRVTDAYAALDAPPHSWEVAVKQLLDAHDHARTVVGNWDCNHAYPIAKFEGTQSFHVREYGPGYRGMAQEIGIDASDWEIGWYTPAREGVVREDYGNSPQDTLNREIDRQRAQLAEVASFSRHPEPR
jgi:hypothetical protein